MYKTVSKRVGSNEKVKECQIVRECSSEEVRECNLVNNHVCNGIHGNEVPSMQCNYVYKVKVGMNLVKYTRMFPRWCGRMFQRGNIGTSLDKDDMMCQKKIDMKFSEGKLTKSLYRNACKSKGVCHQVPNEVHTSVLRKKYVENKGQIYSPNFQHSLPPPIF